ncbi:hypothetical protein MIND_00028500 [Mycena indigotica]|uniref:Uncharacterized protein n=1 Tax=Mycena indigotica TaxID=2126181 RepID=A0A8H6TCX5_9AGAR|nr:uncharacterized protein MIND_00028500 [Mycena indigotica]KAF7315141.1 hypothetical protein MIND_00028500 [Mycena indigotica]
MSFVSSPVAPLSAPASRGALAAAAPASWPVPCVTITVTPATPGGEQTAAQILAGVLVAEPHLLYPPGRLCRSQAVAVAPLVTPAQPLPKTLPLPKALPLPTRPRLRRTSASRTVRRLAAPPPMVRGVGVVGRPQFVPVPARPALRRATPYQTTQRR